MAGWSEAAVEGVARRVEGVTCIGAVATLLSALVLFGSGLEGEGVREDAAEKAGAVRAHDREKVEAEEEEQENAEEEEKEAERKCALLDFGSRRGGWKGKC